MHRFEPKRRQARGHRLFRAMQKGDYAEHVLISLVVTAFLLVQSEAQQATTYNAVVQVNEPFTCRQEGPCWRFTSKQVTRNGCLFNGIKTVSGVCVHGYIPDLLNLIADQTNISWRVTLAGPQVSVNDVFQEFSKPDSLRSFSNTSVCSGFPCDVVALDLTITADRRFNLGAEFSIPIHDNALRLYMRYGEPDFSRAGTWPLKPFSEDLWGSWIGLQAFAALVFLLLDSKQARKRWLYWTKEAWIHEKESNEEGRPGEINLKESCYASILSSVGQSDANEFMSVEARIFVIIYFAFLVIFLSNYTAAVAYWLNADKNFLLLPGVPLSKGDAWVNLVESVPKSPPGTLVIKKGTVVETFTTQDLQVKLDVYRFGVTIDNNSKN